MLSYFSTTNNKVKEPKFNYLNAPKDVQIFESSETLSTSELKSEKTYLRRRWYLDQQESIEHLVFFKNPLKRSIFKTVLFQK